MTKEITYKPWVIRGTMMVNTHALEIDDPDHVYNQIKAQGVNPEDYGIRHPLESEFGDKSRGELVQEILELRKAIDGLARVGLF